MVEIEAFEMLWLNDFFKIIFIQEIGKFHVNIKTSMLSDFNSKTMHDTKIYVNTFRLQI